MRPELRPAKFRQTRQDLSLDILLAPRATDPLVFLADIIQRNASPCSPSPFIAFHSNCSLFLAPKRNHSITHPSALPPHQSQSYLRLSSPSLITSFIKRTPPASTHPLFLSPLPCSVFKASPPFLNSPHIRRPTRACAFVPHSPAVPDIPFCLLLTSRLGPDTDHSPFRA